MSRINQGFRRNKVQCVGVRRTEEEDEGVTRRCKANCGGVGLTPPCVGRGVKVQGEVWGTEEE